MSTAIADLLHEVKKTSERVATVEKTIVEMGKARSDATDVLRKVLSDGRGGAAMTVGFDGADTLGLIRAFGHPRQKAMGWGPFLAKVAQAGQNHNVAGAERELEAMGSIPISKAPLAEGTGNLGGYTVPIQFYAELQRLIAEDSFLRQRCTTIPMTSYTMQVPALNLAGDPPGGASPSSAFFGGLTATWIPEAAPKPESEPTFDQILLTARDLAFHCVISNNLLMDNAVGLDTLLVTMFREAMSWFYDYYILRGTGTSQPLGILNAPATYVIPREAAGSFTLGDAAGMMARLPMRSWNTAVWVLHQSLFEPLVKQVSSDTGGSFAWLKAASAEGGPLAQSPPMELLGRPLYFTEKVPTLGAKGDANLIDASKYLVGDRMAIQIEASIHARFLTNQLVWRIVARWDGAPWLKAPIKLAGPTGGPYYQVSPFVTLDATAEAP